MVEFGGDNDKYLGDIKVLCVARCDGVRSLVWYMWWFR